jgi:hypothetical protein
MIAATTAAILPFAAAGAAFAAPAAGADLQSTAGLQSAVQSGSAGKAITLENNASFSGYDAATDASGRSYIGWIGDNGNGKERQVHLCTLLPGSRSCKGGIQTIDAIGDSSAHDLHVFTTPGGKVTLVWAHDTDASESGPQASEIAAATSQAGGPLSAAADQATSPSFGTMLDAGMAPNGQIWVLSEKSVASGLQVRPGLNNPFVNLKTPYGVGAARVQFNHGTPVIVIQKAGAISAPVAYTSVRNGKFAAFHFLKHTWTAASNIGLVGTSSGVRLDTSVANATYRPEVWSWTGNGFGSPTQTGVVHNNCTPSGHDLVTDASGRVADITNECGFVVVANAPGTRKAATFSFPEHGTAAGGDYQITTTPRGTGWAVWSIESKAGDKLLATPIMLPGEEVTATKTVKGNRVTVTGPASCLPATDIKVGVQGKPARNWHVTASTLRLGTKILHSNTLNGASLKPGATYTLSGTVKFANGGSHATVTAQLKFRSCPN